MVRLFGALLALACMGCTRAEASPAEPAAPPPVILEEKKPPHDELWQEVAKRLAVPEAKLRACKQTSDCTSLPHFKHCCSHVALAKSQIGVVEKQRAKLKDLRSEEDALKCRVAECSKATSPVACAQGWCVLDPYRDIWLKVALHTGMSPEDMRTCTTNDDCTLTQNPERCCDTVALAKRAHAKVVALGDKLMTTREREGCAIKKCVSSQNWTPICNEGLCQLDFAP
jgi:hypothetical protein